MIRSCLAVLFGGLVAAGFGGLVFDPAGHAHRTTLAQGAEKSLEIERYANEPLEFVNLKVSERSVQDRIKPKSRGKNRGRDSVTFEAGDGWYRGVRVTLRNVSGRPIKGIRAYLLFRPPDARTLFSLPLVRSHELKREPLQPGAEIDLFVNERLLTQTLNALSQYGADVRLSSVTLSVDSALFADDLQWYRGKLLRRDPNDHDKWTAVDESGSAPPARRPQAARFAPALFKPAASRQTDVRRCQADSDNNINEQCEGQDQGCRAVEELGNGTPGTLSTTDVVGVCEEVGGVDHPEVVCDAIVIHGRLEPDDTCPTPEPTPTPTPPPYDPCNDQALIEECSMRGGYAAWSYLRCSCCDPSDTTITYCGDVNGYWDYNECICQITSPILIDVAGNGFDLTNAAGGVDFDFDGAGAAERVAWTAVGSDDAWLVLDRDGDGSIESGAELFGNLTPQPAPPAGQERNGFNALAEYDRQANGGNADGVVDRADAVFTSLRLWQDTNHNGVSESGELHALPERGLAALSLKYKESKRRDQHGNRFQYRAKVGDVRGAQAGRWAWDVFLVSARSNAVGGPRRLRAGAGARGGSGGPAMCAADTRLWDRLWSFALDPLRVGLR